MPQEQGRVGSSATAWRKSSASGGSDCVEVAFAPEVALVRQSRNIAGTPLAFSMVSWGAFVDSLRR